MVEWAAVVTRCEAVARVVEVAMARVAVEVRVARVVEVVVVEVAGGVLLEHGPPT